MEFVGKYIFDAAAIIGNGAFAIVFKGYHTQRPNEMVAVKRIAKKTLARVPSVLTKEISILKELTNVKHQNIVSLLDCRQNISCEEQSHKYTIQYCPGRGSIRLCWPSGLELTSSGSPQHLHHRLLQKTVENILI